MKRFNNKILFILLVLLACAFVLTRVFRSPARESNLDTDALAIDTSGIDKIVLYPMADARHEIKLTKDADGWKVSREEKTTLANEDRIETLLAKLAALKPERIVTRKEDKWADYQVSDTTGTEVAVFAGNNERAKLKLGKQSAGVTYVRKAAEDEVYAVTGSVGSAFNLKFDDWRDPSFLQLNKDEITRIAFTYPADSGFVLSRNGGAWMIDNVPADSAKTDSYLNKLKSKRITKFADDFAAGSQPDVTIEIEAGKPVVVKGWHISPEKWILTSDLQPGVYFSDEGNRVAKDIFPGKESLVE